MCKLCVPTLDGLRQSAEKATGDFFSNLPIGIDDTNLSDQQDFASRGLLVADEDFMREKESEISKYDFIEGSCPDTVNPFLWEHAKLNMNYGLFCVNKPDSKPLGVGEIFDVKKGDVFQIRGYDIANMTLVKGKNGWIVMDVLTIPETASVAMETVKKYLGSYPVKAVIYSHTHVDHYGGVEGVFRDPNKSESEIESAIEVAEFIAPKDFLKYVVSENIYAGNAMASRAIFMYGSPLLKDVQGHVDAGLGKSVPLGKSSLIAPTKEIGFDDYAVGKCYCKYRVDGIDLQFQFTPGTEAPTEMNVYMPDQKILFIAENCTGTLHNLYTLRGAEVRDALDWAIYLDETMTTFTDIETICSSHNWPHFGSDKCRDYLMIQRDAYRYLANSTLKLMNEGYTMDEIGRKMDELVPHHMQTEWCNHGFYGTVNHNAKAIYQKYLGWYDSNPCNLNRLIPTESATRYVGCMGGIRAVIRYAKVAYARGEFAWAAELLNKVVFATVKTKKDEKLKNRAKLLNADALEQLGYQAESAPWRNEYLTGAMVLRAEATGCDLPGVCKRVKSVLNDSVVDAMTPEMILQYAGILFDGYTANTAGFTKECIIRFNEDTKHDYRLIANNGILYSKKTKPVPKKSLDFSGSKIGFYNLLIEEPNSVRTETDIGDNLKEILGYVHYFMTNFNIMSPRVDKPFVKV